MNITNFKKSLPFLFKSKVTPFVWGPRGVGKSQSVAQYAKEQGIGFIDLRLGQMEVGDLLGLPEIVKGDDGEGYSTFMKPKWFPTSGKGILFVDEINRARKDVLQAVFQLVLDRKLHTHNLPEGWHIIAAANPNTEDYDVTDVTDAAFMDRFCHIKLEPTTDEWIAFASKAQFSDSVVTFIKQQPGMLGNDVPQYDLEIKPSPRSWDAVSRLLKQDTPSDLFVALAQGLIGVPATAALIESIKAYEQPIKAVEVLDNFESVKELVQKYSDGENARQDLLKVTTDDLVKIISEEGRTFTKIQERNVMDYLKTIPAEMTYVASKDIFPIGSWRKIMTADKEFIKRLETDIEAINVKIRKIEKGGTVDAEEKSQTEENKVDDKA